MKRRPPESTLPRWLTWLGWLSVSCAIIVCLGVWPLTGDDLYRHLTVGRWIWVHGAVLCVDGWLIVTEGKQ